MFDSAQFDQIYFDGQSSLSMSSTGVIQLGMTSPGDRAIVVLRSDTSTVDLFTTANRLRTTVRNGVQQVGIKTSIASAVDLSPVTVASSDSNTALHYSNQREVFYGASRFWVFYTDNLEGDIYYASSLDGTTWASPTYVVQAGVGDFSTWWDGTYVYYVRIYRDGRPEILHYRRGTPSASGVITWTSEQTVETAASNDDDFESPTICVDSSDKPVISYTYWDDSDGKLYGYITKGGNTDGTWGSTAAGFPFQLSSSVETGATLVLPYSSDNKLMAIYCAGNAATIRSKVYNGSSWGTENATTSAIENEGQFSAVVTSDDVVHMVFLKDADDDIKYTHYHSGGTVWEPEDTVYVGTSTMMAPVLSVDYNDNLYCFWIGDPVTNHIYYKQCTGGVWDTNPTDWLTESNVTGNAVITCAYTQLFSEAISICWLTGTGSPYNVRFAATGGTVSTEWWSNRSLILGRDYTEYLGLSLIEDRIITGIRSSKQYLGLTKSGDRIYTGIRKFPMILRLETDATRLREATRLKAITLGLDKVGDRMMTAYRSDSEKFGLLGSSVRSIKNSRLKLVTLGLLGTGDRAIDIIRDPLISLGLYLRSVRNLLVSRLGTSLLGLAPSSLKYLSIFGITTLGLNVVEDRAIELVRDPLVTLGLLPMFDRAIELVRTGMLAFSLRGVSNVVRVMDGFVALGLYSPLRNLGEFPYTFPFEFYNPAGTHRTVEAVRDQSGLLGIANIGDRTIELARALKGYLGLLGSGYRTLSNISRLATTQLALLATQGDRAVGLVRGLRGSLGLTNVGDRTLVVSRSQLQRLGLLPSTNRLLTISRVLFHTLRLPVSATNLNVLGRTGSKTLGVLALSGDRALTLGRTGIKQIGLFAWSGGGGYIARIGVGLLGLTNIGDRAIVTSRTSALTGIGLLASTTSRLVNYTRRSVSNIGILIVSSARSLVLSRTASTLFGLTNIASKVLLTLRSSISTIGMAIISSVRGIEVTRGIPTYLGLQGITSRPIELARSAVITVGLYAHSLQFRFFKGFIELGLTTNATRLVDYNRLYPQLLGLLTTGSRPIEVGRSYIQTLGLTALGSRPLILVRFFPVTLGILESATRLADRVRFGVAYSALIGTSAKVIELGRGVLSPGLLALSAVGNRGILLTRLLLQSLGLLSIAWRGGSYYFAGVIELGLLTTLDRAIVLTRKQPVTLGLSKVGVRAVTFKDRVATIAVGLFPILGIRRILYTRTGLQLLGLLGTAERILGVAFRDLYRTGKTYIGVLSTVGDRALIIRRSQKVNLGIASTSSNYFSYFKMDIVTLGLTTTATRTRLAIRNGIQSFGLKAVFSRRTITIIRDYLVAIGLKVTSYRMLGIGVLYIRNAGVSLGLAVHSIRDVLHIRTAPFMTFGLTTNALRTIFYRRVNPVTVALAPVTDRAIVISRTGTKKLGLLVTSIRSLLARFIMKMTARVNQPYLLISAIKPYCNITPHVNA